MTFYRRYGKRACDLAASVAALIVFLPLMAALALAVRLVMGSPVLFRQQRPGLRARPFTLLKFRTMTEARDEAGELLPDERRLTRLGAFLRRWSLDEIPELWNVLRGDMSFVGPRPLLMRYLPRYRPDQARRHDVRPGISGWAQVNGRDLVTWTQRFAMDVWYVEHVSFSLDVKIAALTVWKALRREGVLDDGRATKDEFLG
ncbi:MAG TPA: sugar transferase [Vicinamibacterales bacterium]|nr:sugar transferase [Vicinamibacterales bacterium]HPK70412.1 sugar transferase [Vicinamibacterales bacterium]